MKTIESILSLLTDHSIVEELRKVLRKNDRDFPMVEMNYKAAMRDIADRIGNQATQELILAYDRQLCSDMPHAGFLGFQANLANFRNPVASQFTNLDYETFLREHVMKTMPQRNAAEATVATYQEIYAEDLYPYEEVIWNYYVHLESTGPKLAHYWGYQFANQILSCVEPGYVSDGAQSSVYTMMLHRDLGFSPT